MAIKRSSKSRTGGEKTSGGSDPSAGGADDRMLHPDFKRMAGMASLALAVVSIAALVVSQEEAPGSIFCYYDHGRIAVPFNLHYFKPRAGGPFGRPAAEEKVKKYALIFRWTEPSAAAPAEGEEARGRWELVDVTRRDKGFWRGVGKVFSAIGRGTVEVGAGILGDLPLRLPVVEFNGSFISDLATGQHETCNAIDTDIVAAIIERATAAGLRPHHRYTAM